MKQSNLMTVLLVMLSAGGSPDIQARYHETITLTDGSVISGFVSKDNLSNGEIEIEADWAITSVPADDVVVAIEECRAFRVDNDTKQWLTTNNFGIPETVHFANITMIGDDCNPDYLLYDQMLSSSSSAFEKLLLEEGDILKYADLTPKTYYLDWSKVARIDRHVDDPGQNWIEEIIPTDGEPAEGIIETQVLRHHRTIKTTDGIRSTFLPKKISSILKKNTGASSLLDIVPVIDIIVMEDSAGGETLEGVIIENNRTKRTFTLLMKDENGESSISIPYSKIKALKYRRNK